MERKNIVGIMFTIMMIIGFMSLISTNVSKELSNKDLIHKAVLSNNIEATRFLISQGIDINSKYKHKHTLLHSAALYGDINMVKLLVENKAKLIKNNFELTAINSAKEMNHTHIVKYLKNNIDNSEYE